MLSASLKNKLQTLALRHEELEHLLASPEVIQQQEQFRKLSKEYAELETLTSTFHHYQQILDQEAETNSLLEEADLEIRAMAQQELQELKKEKEDLVLSLQYLLLPKDPNDTCNIFLEIRAAAGGDESAIFAGDLFRMYTRYAQNQQWQIELIHKNDGEHGGFKEVIARISGQDVYSRLKFESGAHRVQRVPETEAQGRVHTSTCTVAILPEVESIDEVQLNPADLKIDTFRASGAGGQHINKTDSAIRITHLPSGLVVECQDERSQHKNRARAMSLLYAKLLDQEREKQQSAQAAARKSLVGTGDRSERIRTYNFPQTRLTDHRINLTLYKLAAIMEGDLNQIIEPLIQEHQADQLQQFHQND